MTDPVACSGARLVYLSLTFGGIGWLELKTITTESMYFICYFQLRPTPLYCTACPDIITLKGNAIKPEQLAIESNF